MSCAGNGYLTGNMLVSFPVKDGQFLPWGDGVSASDAQMALERCFVDAAVHVSDQSTVSSGWPAIGRFSKNGSALSFSLSVGEHSVPLTVSASSVRFPIVRGTAPWGWFVVVLSSEGIRDFCESEFTPPAPSNSSPLGRGGGYWLDLCDKCVTVTPIGLTSIRVYDGVHSEESGPHFVLSGNVAVVPGNNMTVTPSDEDNSIELAAVPGAGAGTVPCECPEETRKFQLMSADGHARLFNDTCYDFEPIYWKGQVVHVWVHNKCTACCTCDMYASIVNDRLKPLAEALRNARETLYGDKQDSLLARYKYAVEAFNVRIRGPVPEDIRFTVTGMPVGLNISPKMGSRTSSSVSVKGYMERCTFKGTLRNTSAYPVYVSVLGLSVAAKDNSPMVVVEATASWVNGAQKTRTVTGDGASLPDVSDVEVDAGCTMEVTFIARKNLKVASVYTKTGYTGEITLSVWGRDRDGAKVMLGDDGAQLKRSVDI